MEKILWPYGHRASGKGPVSDTVRQAMSPKPENKPGEGLASEDLPSPPELEDSSFDDSSDDNDSTLGLLPKKKKKKRRKKFTRHLNQESTRKECLRPYWLGFSLCLTLFAFWLLDSLKDPVFATLVDGNLDQHQPPAKLCSVLSTLVLVCLMEFLSHARKKQRSEEIRFTSDQEILDGGGRWTRMSMDQQSQEQQQECTDVDRVSISIFTYVGGAYAMVFVFMAYLLRFHPSFSGQVDYSSTNNSTAWPVVRDLSTDSTAWPVEQESYNSTAWHVLAYILYATIESFGSISVATFWSYTNSTLSLVDAERFYGPIIAMAQLGAIGGSTMVTTHYWSAFTLFLVACLIIVLQVLVIASYGKRYKPTNEAEQVIEEEHDESGPSRVGKLKKSSSWPDLSMLWSGVHLILRHNYVLLILGVSCLYEVSLTCLDYQMKLMGWSRFEDQGTSSSNMSFTQFMGHYGQMTNVTSLFLSYICFPFLIRTYGLRRTLLLFPTLLLVCTLFAYGAMPGNLAVLFFSMSILKAMTYSIHDPSKELLYLPTSNAIKFRAKFWIDVVGARIAKAVGSSINTYAGSVDRIVRIGSVPSLATAFALWLVCYRAGIQFDTLVRDNSVVGHEGTNKEAKVDYQYVDTAQEQDEEDQKSGTEEESPLKPEETKA